MQIKSKKMKHNHNLQILNRCFNSVKTRVEFIIIIIIMMIIIKAFFIEGKKPNQYKTVFRWALHMTI